MSSSIINLSHLFTKFTLGSINNIICAGINPIDKHKDITPVLNVAEITDTKIYDTETEPTNHNIKSYGGGSNTNKAGLLFEQKACLYSLCKEI